MKFNVRMFIMLLLCFNLSTFIYGQSPQKNPTITDPNNTQGAKALSSEDFENSVVLVQDLSAFKGKSSSFKAPISIQVLNFHKSKKLLPAYTFDGVAYSDDGKHNDAVAGDGVFTSTRKVSVSSSDQLPDKRFLASTGFKYNDAFGQYASASGMSKSGIGFSCKVRIITCPETHWWNSCWPLSSPCSCVEFYDCEIGISIF